MRSLLVCLAVCLLVLPFVGCGEDAVCACEQGKAGETLWCAPCGTGYVDGRETSCRGCYDAMQGGSACEACAKK